MKKLLIVIVLFSGMTQDVCADQSYNGITITDNYVSDCMGCGMSGSILKCACKNNSGNYVDTSIDLANIDTTSEYLENNNGKLIFKKRDVHTQQLQSKRQNLYRSNHH